MAECPIPKKMYPEQSEQIRLTGHYRRKNKFLVLFLISCAVLIAGFAVSALWGNGGADWLENRQDGIPNEQDTDDTEGTIRDSESDSGAEEDLEPSVIPTDATPIVSRDLSLADRGIKYINNESIYAPDLEALLEYDISSAISDGPMVLILHTHTSEAYMEMEEAYIQGNLGTVTYSDDEKRNVIGVGEVLCDTLNQNGLSAIHCRAIHDGDGMRGAYDRAEESIRFFLTHYPSIKYVIDLHRDAILTEGGEYVRAVTEIDGEAVAQVMSVVGSDGGGEACDGWEENLALALQLRSMLNSNGKSICRPVTLRNATYNQEFAPYSLLLEIGTGANSVEEAKRAAELVGKSLANLIGK